MMRQRASGSGQPAGGGPQSYYGGYGAGGAGGAGYSSSNGGGGSGGGYGNGSGSGSGSGNGSNSNGGGNAGYGGYSNGSYGGYSAGYASTTTPTPTTTEDKYSKRKSSSTFSLPSLGSVFGGNPLVLVCVLMGLWSILMMGFWMNVRVKYNSILKEFNAPNADSIVDLYKNLQSDLADAQQKKDKSVRENDRKKAVMQRDLERETRRLQKERDELRVKYEGPDKEEEESRLQLREEAFQNQVALLQEATRKESKRNVLERFGPGPHEVEFSFTMQEKDRSFVVELASLEDVPHAVHVFLEQVEHGLWNGCYFYLNGPHVIQAGPQLSDEDEAEGPSSDENEDDEDREAAMIPFKSQGLDKLAFPDYSDNFPHLPFTLGFTGRPGGPDFYINKVDNKKSHGPGGQYQHALEEQGDSCFAKIIRGKDHAAALFAQPVYKDRSEWHYFLEEPVKIIKAEILTKNPGGTGDSNVPKINVPPGDEASTQTGATKEETAEEPPHDDPVQNLIEKRKRKPRRPKIEHAVEP